MSQWELWALVLLAGLGVSLARAIERWGQSRKGHVERGQRLRHPIGLEDDRFRLWVRAGSELPLVSRHMLRLRAQGGASYDIALRCAPDGDPLVVTLGPMPDDPPPRLIEIEVAVDPRGRLRIAACERTTRRLLPATFAAGAPEPLTLADSDWEPPEGPDAFGEEPGTIDPSMDPELLRRLGRD